MCRVIGYLGSNMPLSVILYDSDSSLVRQAYSATMSQHLNLAGCGVAAWKNGSGRSEEPLLYKETALPMFDRNLQSVASTVESSCVIAHIRGADYFQHGAADVSRANVHPFYYPGAPIALAHNGGLKEFDKMKYDLVEHIGPALATKIEGTTDSEWIYALVLSQLEPTERDLTADDIAQAVIRALRVLRKVRNKHDIHTASGTNVFIADGHSLVATRFTFDFGCYEGLISSAELTYHSLWYTIGRDYGPSDGEWKMTGTVQEADSVIIASEPLTRDTSTWLEVPEYTLFSASREDGGLRIETSDLDI